MSRSMLKRKRFDALSDSGNSEGSAASAVDATGLLSTLQGHIDDLRSILYCGVCVKLLYEPFTLPCGHTFCYGCLAEWFSSQDNRKTCPDCRGVVKTEPAPAYLIRNFVQIFIGRPELLEANETTQQHLENQRAESAKVEADKNNNHVTTGGLFKGCFKNAGAPIVDAGDGVERCPLCFWELEEDECNRCGFRDTNWEGQEVWDAEMAMRLAGVGDEMSGSDESRSENDEEDGSSEMDSFIDDDDGRSVSPANSDRSNSTAREVFRNRPRSESFDTTDHWEPSSSFDLPAFQRNHNNRIIRDDDDEEEEEEEEVERDYCDDIDDLEGIDFDDDDEDDDDDDEGPIGPTARRTQRNFDHGIEGLNRIMGFPRHTINNPFRSPQHHHMPGSHSRNPIALDSDSPRQPSRHRRRVPQVCRRTEHTFSHYMSITRR